MPREPFEPRGVLLVGGPRHGERYYVRHPHICFARLPVGWERLIRDPSVADVQPVTRKDCYRVDGDKAHYVE